MNKYCWIVLLVLNSHNWNTSITGVSIWFGLIWFYSISTIVGYLMSNPYLYIQIVLFQTILFSIRMQFSSIWPIDRALSGLGQSGPGSDGNKGVLCIPQSSSITGVSPLDSLVSYPSTEMQLVYSAALADWAIFNCV